MIRFLMAIFGALCISSTMAQGEQTVAAANEITFFGLDCSHLEVIGETGLSGEDWINKYFKGWNGVVMQERDKYDLKQAFRKTKVNYDLSVVDPLNSQRDPSTIDVLEGAILTEDELVEHISTNFKTGESGVGLVIVLDEFNKYEELGTMWVTFFDMNSGVVLLAKKMSAKPMGFGLRNYWVRTVYNVLEDSKSQYRRWVKQ